MRKVAVIISGFLRNAHALLQTIIKAHVKFQKARLKPVEGVIGPKYLIEIRNYAPRITHHAPRKGENNVPPLFFEKAGDENSGFCKVEFSQTS